MHKKRRAETERKLMSEFSDSARLKKLLANSLPRVIEILKDKLCEWSKFVCVLKHEEDSPI